MKRKVSKQKKKKQVRREPLAGNRAAKPLPRFQALMEAYAKAFVPKDTKLRNSGGCDGEGTEGAYGSLTFQAQLRLTWDLMANEELPTHPAVWRSGSKPVIVDFGAGTGRPLVLWQALNLVHRAIGYEVDAAKVEKAAAYMRWMVHLVRYESGLPVRMDSPQVLQQDVTELQPGAVAAHRPTVGYSFCAGMPKDAKKAMGAIFLHCATMKVLVLVDYGNTSPTLLLAQLLVGAAAQDPAEVERLAERIEKTFTFRIMKNLAAMGSSSKYRALIVNKKGPGDYPTPAGLLL